MQYLVITKDQILAALLLAALPLIAVGQDFANLGRYQVDNRYLVEHNRRIDVVIIGDSITERWVRSRPHFFDQTGLVGRGIVGKTTPQLLLRFRQDVVNLRPKMVVILAGTNDIAGNSGK